MRTSPSIARIRFHFAFIFFIFFRLVFVFLNIDFVRWTMFLLSAADLLGRIRRRFFDFLFRLFFLDFGSSIFLIDSLGFFICHFHNTWRIVRCRFFFFAFFAQFLSSNTIGLNNVRRSISLSFLSLLTSSRSAFSFRCFSTAIFSHFRHAWRTNSSGFCVIFGLVKRSVFRAKNPNNVSSN